MMLRQQSSKQPPRTKPEKFIQYVKRYKPQSQVMRFINLLQTDRLQLASKVLDYFLELSLNNNLIGCFKTISSKIPVPNIAQYVERRDALQEKSAKAVIDLRKQAVTLASQNANKELSHSYLRLAEIFTDFGEYEEAEDCLKKIKDLNLLDAESYYPLWVKICMFSMKTGHARGLLLKLPQDHRTMPEVREYLIAQDLREVAQAKPTILNNILSFNLKGPQLKNVFLQQSQLGEYYSLLTLASGKRQLSKKFLSWSARLQKHHVGLQYKKLLQEVDRVIEKYQFDPWIGRRHELRRQIRSNMFMEVVKAYKVFKIELVEEELGIKEEEMQSMLIENKNSEFRYLLDPVTRTVHQVQAKSRLLLNLEAINRLLRTKQDSILAPKEEDRMFDRDVDDFHHY